MVYIFAVYMAVGCVFTLHPYLRFVIGATPLTPFIWPIQLTKEIGRELGWHLAGMAIAQLIIIFWLVTH